MKIIITLLLTLYALSSCVKEPSYDSNTLEERALKAWIKKNRPELMNNFQEEGGYYVDVLAWGESTATATENSKENDLGNLPIMEQDTCWVYYTFSGYDLDGNMCVTRNEMQARLQGTYSDRTHYAPYGNYCGESNYYTVVEGSYLSMRNKITLGEEYVKNNPQCQGTELLLRKGSKVRLYMPSSIGYSASGSNAEGGYEGQYTLDSHVPLIMDMEIIRVVKNPSDAELDMINAVVNKSNEASSEPIWMQVKNSGTEEGEEEENDPNADSATDTEGSEDKEDEYYEGLYYTTNFTPTNKFPHLEYTSPDKVGLGHPYKDSKRFTDMAEFDKKLWKILDEKFADMINKTSDEAAEEIGEENGAIIWYVGRFLDGFIFDTNIDEVTELVFNEADAGGSSISYSVSSNKDEYISAWAHCIPKLRYGRWGAIITSSGYAYGTTGVSGSTSTSSSGGMDYSYYNMLNYYNYYNSYNSYYYNPYNYYNYYNYYGGYNSSYDYETTSTIETEIMPYTPLVFYIFIEPTE